MGKKILAIIIFLILIGAAGYVLYKKSAKPAQAPTVAQEQQNPAPTSAAPTAATQPSVTPKPTASPKAIDLGGKQSQGTFSSGEGDSAAPNIQVYEVDFDGNKFTPASLNISVNDWVFFKNDSTEDMWVASNPHPAHTDYPGFDSKQNIAPGKQYKFQFTKAGTWGYHDHLDPAIGGAIIVK